MGRRHPQVRIGVTVTQGPPSDRWHHGRVTSSLVRAYVPDLAHALVYICGPQPMIDAMKALMSELGLPPAQVRSESFGAAMKLVTTEADAPAEEFSSSAAARRPPREPAAAPNVVRFARSCCKLCVPAAQTLLEAAEERGVDIPSVCRAGTCHTCRTRLVEGDAVCNSDTLSDEDRAEGDILPCVSHARSDCVLEA